MIEVAIAAAQAAAEKVIEGASQAKEVHQKAPRSLVTNFDLAAEKAAIDIIRGKFPSHAILSEEAGSLAGSGEYTWVIDPIDGTANFTSGIPFYCVAIAAMRGPEVVAAAVIDPMRQETFTAERGSGAFSNGERIQVSGASRWQDVVLGYDLGYSDERASQTFGIAGFLRPKVRNLRTLGSAVLGLAYVATGRFEAYVHSSLAPWDLAAGWLLAEEAGGVVTDLTGQRATIHTKSVLASSQLLHHSMLAELPEGLLLLPA
ncbi:MAG: inositol monophosphatase [Chloroflexi bacterium]|nr:inositol monophosphatase [Chloroflexota bacterium]